MNVTCLNVFFFDLFTDEVLMFKENQKKEKLRTTKRKEKRKK